MYCTQIILWHRETLERREFRDVRQTTGVQQGIFPAPGWAGNSKQFVAEERLAGKHLICL